jgi:hypothetical protein
MLQTSTYRSRSYRYIQLERAYRSANLLANLNDRMKFENDYLQSIRERQFETFVRRSYETLHNSHEQIRNEQANQQTRAFTSVNLEREFLANDPSRDIKIVFVDDHPSRNTYVRKCMCMSVCMHTFE